MATTVSNAFAEFSKNIEPTQNEIDRMIRRHQYIREKLRNKIYNDPRKLDFLSGSYKRHTQIRPINDVDIMIVLDYERYWQDFGMNPLKLLRFLKKILGETYPSVEMRIQTHSIGLEFKEIPEVDIVPSFLINEKEEIYIIPDKEFSVYIKTSPVKHEKIISDHNKKLKQKFIPLIKILKKWRDNNNINFKSFHLEVFSMSILTKQFQNFQGILPYYFENASKVILNTCNDPASLSGDISNYLSEFDKLKLSKKFSETSIFCKNLIELERNGKHQKAIEGWHRILGDPFPKPILTTSSSYKGGKATKFPPEGKNYTFGV